MLEQCVHYSLTLRMVLLGYANILLGNQRVRCNIMYTREIENIANRRFQKYPAFFVYIMVQSVPSVHAVTHNLMNVLLLAAMLHL